MPLPASITGSAARFAAAALAVGTLAGGGAAIAGAGVAGAATATTRAAPPGATALRNCLAQHGVTLKARPFGGAPPGASGRGGPPPAGGLGGPPSGRSGGGQFPKNSKFAKAFAACRSKFPGAGFVGQRPFKPTAAQQAALSTFEQCLATHGVKVAPNASFQTIRSLMQADPAAAKACQSDLKGVFGPPRGSGPGAPGGTAPPTT